MSESTSRSGAVNLGPHGFENDELNVGHCKLCNGFAGGLIHRLHRCDGCGCGDDYQGYKGWANISIVVSDESGQRVQPIGRYCPLCKDRPWDHVGRTGAGDMLFNEHELCVALGVEGLRHNEFEEPAVSRLRWMLAEYGEPHVTPSEKPATNSAPHLHQCMRCARTFPCLSPSHCTAAHKVMPRVVVMGEHGPELFEHVCEAKK